MSLTNLGFPAGVRVRVRAIDNPEIVVRSAPGIYLT